MARFYAEMQGHRGPASRLGTAKSGIFASASGWHVGGKVEVFPAGDDPEDDRVEIFLTTGSSGSEKKLIASCKASEVERVIAGELPLITSGRG